MIPVLGVVSIRNFEGNNKFRLWIPVILLWLLLLPIAVLVLPVFVIVCLVSQVNPFRAIAAIWQVLVALKDTHIEVKNRNALVLVQIL